MDIVNINIDSISNCLFVDTEKFDVIDSKSVDLADALYNYEFV